jgi:hypothetical protein
MPPTRLGHIRNELGPSRRSGPAQKNSNDEQDDSRAALPKDVALANEKRSDQKNHLITAAHRRGGGADPPDRSWMRALLLSNQPEAPFPILTL